MAYFPEGEMMMMIRSEGDMETMIMYRAACSGMQQSSWPLQGEAWADRSGENRQDAAKKRFKT
jgi:hypothetical protein